MSEKKPILKKKKEIDPKEFTTCEATRRMIVKGRKDGIETAFDRAANMKACPIGEDSACCKHCFMGPCRLNAKDPYSKVGVCGATIDTIMARNFARMVASGGAAHTDHGMSMLDLFREVVNGNIKDYKIKNEEKLLKVCEYVGIETEGRDIKEIALELYEELERTYTQVEGEIPFAKRVPEKRWRPGGKKASCPGARCAKSWNACIGPTWAWTRITRTLPSSSAGRRWPTDGAARWWPPRFPTSSSASPRRCPSRSTWAF
jgi:carbon-monoxide dehydrogenase catalytic subunit